MQILCSSYDIAVLRYVANRSNFVLLQIQIGFNELYYSLVNLPAVGLNRRAETLCQRKELKKAWQAAWLLRATTCIDSNEQRLCYKAQHPIRDDLIEAFDMKDAVATGFSAGQTPLEIKLIEIQRAVESGASEIDIVISRTEALHGDWKGIFEGM
uniref:deoxyribose-phosphate aldolase-like n=1 Tax=Styela clava TaxID=7725 RepID=UPI00193A3660|nr:deoxyribose-phosphate aldolase-like [Styela clava]